MSSNAETKSVMKVKISKKDSKKSLKVEDSQETSKVEVKIPEGSIPVDEDVEEDDESVVFEEGTKIVSVSEFTASKGSAFIASFADVECSTQVQPSESIANIEDESQKIALPVRLDTDDDEEEERLVRQLEEIRRRKEQKKTAERREATYAERRQERREMFVAEIAKLQQQLADFDELTPEEFWENEDKFNPPKAKKTAKAKTPDSEDESEGSGKKVKAKVERRPLTEALKVGDRIHLKRTLKTGPVLDGVWNGNAFEFEENNYKTLSLLLNRHKEILGITTSLNAWIQYVLITEEGYSDLDTYCRE